MWLFLCTLLIKEIQMEGKFLYPNIAYFTLQKELPSCNVGDVVTIVDADGRECLTVNGIEMPIDIAQKHPEWFKAVTEAEHVQACKENTISYLMSEKGKTKDEVESLYEKFVHETI